MRHAILAAVLLAGAASGPGIAAACGALPEPYFTLTAALPGPGTVPRDPGLVFRGKAWSPPGGPTSFASVRLTDEAGRRVATVEVPWYGGEPAVAFRPVEPLAPGARYVAEAAIAEGGPPAPAGASGPQTLRFEFQTSAQLALPLRLAGPLVVRLEAAEEPVLACAVRGLCGGPSSGCKQTGTRRLLRARITVPAASGGVDFDGYRAWLHFTADDPAAFSGPGEGRQTRPGNVNLFSLLSLKPGMETEVSQEILKQERPYAPCFALNVWDPAGHAVQSPPLCLDRMDPDAVARTLSSGKPAPEMPRPATAHPTPAEPLPPVVGEDATREAGGCAVGGGGAGGPLALFAAASVLASLRARRRSPDFRG